MVISPHVYGPSVTHADAHYKGPELWRRLTLSFGYLTQQGYCEGGDCQRFPVALGEFGSRCAAAWPTAEAAVPCWR